MEFSDDFSVLQGAFRRAEQQALPKTLAEIVNKKDCKQYATVITEAVNDIIAGLSTDNNSVQKEFSRFKIHAAFFVKWMDRPSSISEKSDDVVKNSHETGIGNLSVFDTIHRSLPAFDTPVYVSLLKTCGMGKHCSECLLQLPVKTQNVYLAELITCMTTDLNDGDVQLWIDMLQSALTWSQGHMETYGESGHQVITTLLKSFDKMKNTVCERETKWRIIKLFSDCLCCMMTDWPTSRGQSHKGQKTSARSLSENEVIQHCRRLDNLLTRNVNLESSSQIVSLTHGLEKISPYMSHSKNVTNLNFGVRLEVIATVIPLLRDVLCNVWPELLMDSEDKCKDDTREKQSVTHFSETLSTLYDTLEMLSVSDVFREDSLTEGSENIPSLRNYTEELCEKLKNISLAPSDSAPISAELPETHTQIGKVTDTSISEDVFEVKFKEAVWRVNERLKGYQECMEWLLSSGCRQLWFCDKRWIECIGTNLPGMSSAQLTIQLITILHEVMSSPTSEINQKELLFELREVTLQCFRTLPIMLQNRIRDHIVDTYGLPTIFEQSLPASYHQHLTTVFNQLVNVDKKSDFQELLAEVSSLCFQSPCETLSKAISVAISSSAQVHLIIQILQCMASSCKYKINSDTTILCQELYQAGITSSESAMQKNNFLELVRLLLQPFKSPLDQTSPLTHPPLLDVQELVKTCVLPYLSLNYKQTDNTLPTSTALLLFKVALETTRSLDGSHWMIDLSHIP
ncbi:uncharacterized protein [Ptychodera flava]|uniref:uncharacterized protein n=1 Tax=Ptychodera flava TaxID=63121 RepID=UPI00396AA2C0